MENQVAKKEKTEYPSLLSVKQIIQYTGLARSKAYDCVNCTDAPVVIIGCRKYMIRDKLIPWLEQHYGINGKN